MRCVECGATAGTTYRQFPNGTFKLVKCTSCGAFVDGYVEYELTIVVLDMILYRPQAYRHLIFNFLPAMPLSRLTGLPRPFDFLALLFIFLDAYVFLLTRHCAEGTLKSLQLKFTRHLLADDWNDFMFTLAVVALSYAAYFIGVHLVVTRLPPSWSLNGKLKSPIAHPPMHTGRLPSMSSPTGSAAGKAVAPATAPGPSAKDFSATQVALTLLLSSYGKLLLFLLLIWEYPAYFTILANCIVVSSQLLGLRVCLALDAQRAALAVGVGIGLCLAVRSLLWSGAQVPCDIPG
eukprot:GGOE01045891.1.p1 GENE.GGOE01045891.1~~GGOE01045891.1.p1  ORF type:complete len:291 (+),score=84.02 GGOE01045891.1:112-984(+)